MCSAFLPNFFCLGTFFSPSLHPSPKGVRGSNKVSLHLTRKCKCVLFPFGRNQKAKTWQGWNLSESLRPPLRYHISGFLWLNTSSSWLLGLVCEVCPWQHVDLNWTRAFSITVKMHYALLQAYLYNAFPFSRIHFPLIWIYPDILNSSFTQYLLRTGAKP